MKRKRVVGVQTIEEVVVKEKKHHDSSPLAYEKIRQQRIKQNKERMRSLGILQISQQLSASSTKTKTKRSKANPTPPPPPHSIRRSSRLGNASPLSNAEEKEKSKRKGESPLDLAAVEGTRVEEEEEKSRRKVGSPLDLDVVEGQRVEEEENSKRKVGSPLDLAAVEGKGVEKEEVYREEHIKLLGSCHQTWNLHSDGNRAYYDRVNGQTCHQCRYGFPMAAAYKVFS